MGLETGARRRESSGQPRHPQVPGRKGRTESRAGPGVGAAPGGNGLEGEEGGEVVKGGVVEGGGVVSEGENLVDYIMKI